MYQQNCWMIWTTNGGHKDLVIRSPGATGSSIDPQRMDWKCLLRRTLSEQWMNKWKWDSSCLWKNEQKFLLWLKAHDNELAPWSWTHSSLKEALVSARVVVTNATRTWSRILFVKPIAGFALITSPTAALRRLLLGMEGPLFRLMETTLMMSTPWRTGTSGVFCFSEPGSRFTTIILSASLFKKSVSFTSSQRTWFEQMTTFQWPNVVNSKSFLWLSHFSFHKQWFFSRMLPFAADKSASEMLSLISHSVGKTGKCNCMQSSKRNHRSMHSRNSNAHTCTNESHWWTRFITTWPQEACRNQVLWVRPCLVGLNDVSIHCRVFRLPTAGSEFLNSKNREEHTNVNVKLRCIL